MVKVLGFLFSLIMGTGTVIALAVVVLAVIASLTR